MMSRRTLEGALKWALRDLRLEDEMSVGEMSITDPSKNWMYRNYSLALTLAIVIDCTDGGQGVDLTD
jgi:hypothetical protein